MCKECWKKYGVKSTEKYLKKKTHNIFQNILAWPLSEANVSLWIFSFPVKDTSFTSWADATLPYWTYACSQV